MSHDNLLGPEPVRLPVDGPDADVRAALTAGADLQDAARENPASPYAWALLAERALADDGDPVAAYAYARTGYHRGLDALRKAGWRGRGPILDVRVTFRGCWCAAAGARVCGPRALLAPDVAQTGPPSSAESGESM